ncbi:MAG TPA: hypothetical protein VIG08_13050 [Gemmatimonadales bacterium]|jgi:hypothetical protein
MKLSHEQRAIALGVVAALVGVNMAWMYAHWPLGKPGPDIDQAWWMARQILAGENPYAADRVARVFATLIYYPMTAAVVSLPLAPLDPTPMRFVFVIGSAGLFGYAIGRMKPYLWPAFLGMPFLISLGSAQWAPLLVTGMLWSSLGWLGCVKPNLGVVMLAGARSRRDALILVGGGLLVVLVSLAILPRWPLDWLTALKASTHFKPLVYRPGGFLLLLAALRWREPEARVLLALGLVPVTGLVYDMLPAILVCRTAGQAVVLTLVGYIPWFTIGHSNTLEDQMWHNGITTLWFELMPAVAILLMRFLPDDWWARVLRRLRPVE